MGIVRDNVVCFEDYKQRRKEEDLEDFIMTMLEASESLVEILEEIPVRKAKVHVTFDSFDRGD